MRAHARVIALSSVSLFLAASGRAAAQQRYRLEERVARGRAWVAPVGLACR